MNKNFRLLSLILILGIAFISCNQKKELRNSVISKKESKFTNLTGPYLGQKPPGIKAELFAPGIISTSLDDAKILFSAEGRECYFSVRGSTFKSDYFILSTQMEDNHWTTPILMNLIKNKNNMYPFITKNSKKLFFTSSWIKKGTKEKCSNIMYLLKENGDWGLPRIVTYGEKNEKMQGYFVSATSNGNLYFQMSQDIYMSIYLNGNYLKPEKLSNKINSRGFEGHPYVSSDESYLIFDAIRNDNFVNSDLYISFKDKNGEWLGARKMGEDINGPSHDFGPFVTPDGKYLFFNSDRMKNTKRKEIENKELSFQELQDLQNAPGNGSSDFYWVDARVIADLKPKHLK